MADGGGVRAAGTRHAHRGVVFLTNGVSRASPEVSVRMDPGNGVGPRRTLDSPDTALRHASASHKGLSGPPQNRYRAPTNA